MTSYNDLLSVSEAKNEKNAEETKSFIECLCLSQSEKLFNAHSSFPKVDIIKNNEIDEIKRPTKKKKKKKSKKKQATNTNILDAVKIFLNSSDTDFHSCFEKSDDMYESAEDKLFDDGDNDNEKQLELNEVNEASRKKIYIGGTDSGKVDRSIYKYWYQRYLLFSRFDDGVMLDYGLYFLLH